MELLKALLSSGTCDTEEEALEIIQEMKHDVLDGSDPEEVLYDYGFEPDYIFDII